MAAAFTFMPRPLCISISRCHPKFSVFHNTISSCSVSSSSLTFSHFRPLAAVKFSFSSESLPVLPQEIDRLQDEILDEIEEYDAKYSADSENHSESVDTEVGSSGSPVDKPEANRSSNVPNLTMKEKKELASYAHGLGKKLKSQLVGKSGVTQNVAFSFVETLEANELLKVKIHRTCPGELEEVVKQLEEATGSVVVGQIGRTVIIYRPSVAKMKAEQKKKEAQKVFLRRESSLAKMKAKEKKKETRKVFLRRESNATTPLSKKGQVPKPHGRGRRGASRV